MRGLEGIQFKELVLVPEDPDSVLRVSVATEPACQQLLCSGAGLCVTGRGRAVSVDSGHPCSPNPCPVRGEARPNFRDAKREKMLRGVQKLVSCISCNLPGRRL